MFNYLYLVHKHYTANITPPQPAATGTIAWNVVENRQIPNCKSVYFGSSNLLFH